MTQLLYVEASPRKSRSKSISVARAFLEKYQSVNPHHRIHTIDLWQKKLPEFDGFTIDAKYQVLHGQSFTADQQAAWQKVIDVCDEFKAADKYLISIPMWNFGIPYKLKHYIDVLAQPGQTFSYSPDTGYTGLVSGKPVTVIYARGGAYGSEQAKGLDWQKGYMDLLLGFIGFTDIRSVVIEPTMSSPEEVAKTEQAAIALAQSIAAAY